jgi:hypothetical protein
MKGKSFVTLTIGDFETAAGFSLTPEPEAATTTGWSLPSNYTLSFGLFFCLNVFQSAFSTCRVGLAEAH